MSYKDDMKEKDPTPFPIIKDNTMSALLAAFANPMGNTNMPAGLLQFTEDEDENN